MFYLEAVLLGLGLSMDAAAVSMANGLKEPCMSLKKSLAIAATYGIFQGLMPLIGYAAGSLLTQWIARIAPYLAFAVLGFLGIKMIVEGCKKSDPCDTQPLTVKGLLVQAIATSVDALTVGVIYAAEPIGRASAVFAIVAAVTFSVAAGAVGIGKKFGTVFSGKAEIVGGVILVAIGLKILIEHLVTIL